MANGAPLVVPPTAQPSLADPIEILESPASGMLVTIGVQAQLRKCRMKDFPSSSVVGSITPPMAQPSSGETMSREPISPSLGTCAVIFPGAQTPCAGEKLPYPPFVVWPRGA